MKIANVTYGRFIRIDVYSFLYHHARGVLEALAARLFVTPVSWFRFKFSFVLMLHTARDTKEDIYPTFS